MKIDFSEEEYRRLVDVLSLAGMVLDAYGHGQEDRRQGYFELEQKLLSYFEDFGCRDLLRRDVASGQYVRKWSKERNEAIVRIMDNYNDDCFWDEIIIRMADRDMKARLTLEGRDGSKLSQEESDKLKQDFESRHEQEFRSNGLANLVLRTEAAEGTN